MGIAALNSPNLFAEAPIASDRARLPQSAGETEAAAGLAAARPAGKDSVTISEQARQRSRDDQGASDGRSPEEVPSGEPAGAKQLTAEEKQQVEQLKRRDAEVKAHEQAHLAALGGEGGSASYEYTTGPDGRRYATGGEVPVSIGAVPGDPRATIARAQRVARAAVAPAQPSAADLSARAKATQVEREARAELQAEQTEGLRGDESEGAEAPAEFGATGSGDPIQSGSKSGACAVCGGDHGPEVSHAAEEILGANLNFSRIS